MAPAAETLTATTRLSSLRLPSQAGLPLAAHPPKSSGHCSRLERGCCWRSSQLPHQHQDAYGSSGEEAPPAAGTAPSQSPYDNWEDAADQWEDEYPVEGHASHAEPEQTSSHLQHPEDSSSQVETDYQTEEHYSQEVAWTSQPDLSSDFAALSIGASGQQQIHWGAEAASEYARPPPAGSPFCPQHFASGTCEASDCQLLHGLYCEVHHLLIKLALPERCMLPG